MSIQVRGARKSFRPHRGDVVQALDGVDLEVADGELLVVVGPSGSGKSTLLRAVAGLETLDAGTVSVAGRDVTRLPPGRRDVALVFQDYALFPHLNVADNIGFGERARGGRRDAVSAKVAAAADSLGLGKLLRRYPRELSGGERQRVALARVLVREPKAFLLDEPLANLDADLRLRTRAELRTVQRRLGAATLYVTHDQHEALALGDRVAVIHTGRVEQVGTPDEVYARPATGYVARLLGALPMNLLPASLAGGGPAPILGVRPERLRVVAGAATGARLDGEVVAVEPGGEESVVHVVRGDVRILVRVGAAAAPTVGATVGLDWDNTDSHWYASYDGARVSPDQSGSAAELPSPAAAPPGPAAGPESGA
ncbi:MAG: ABC transporter ATP-binding protein [Micromonosporaceae bacterium]